MRFRRAIKQDLPALMTLWGRVFEDDPPFIQQNLHRFVGIEHLYIAESDQLVAQLCAVPCTIGKAKGIYLYALATQPEWQRQGIMSRLMEHAEQQEKQSGAVFSALIPASEILYHYYDKRGYNCRSVLRVIRRKIGGVFHTVARTGVLDASELIWLRRRYMGEQTLSFDAVRTQEILLDLFSSGADSVVTEHGYAIYLKQGDQLMVAEMFAESDQHGELLLQAIRQQTGLEKAVVTLPQASQLWENQGEKKPNGLLKSLVQDNIIEDFYIRFAFDEI